MLVVPELFDLPFRVIAPILFLTLSVTPLTFSPEMSILSFSSLRTYLKSLLLSLRCLYKPLTIKSTSFDCPVTLLPFPMHFCSLPYTCIALSAHGSGQLHL